MSKRSSFASIQTSQIIASDAYTVNPMRTSYESIMAHRGSELYAKVAKQDGKVTEVTDQYMLVTYKDGTTDTYELGYYVGEAAGEYHKHNRVTDLKVGDKFQLGDIIGFNETWLARDIFNPGQVAMKTGIMTRMVLMDAVDTFEDSISVSLNFSNISTSPYIKRKGFMLDAEDRLVMKVKEGDSVDYDTILCEIEEGHLAALSTGEDSQIDEINRLGIRQIKSHHHGIITKIDVSYNCEVESMSESVGKLVKAKDKLTKQLAKATNSQIVDNRVSSVGAKQTVMEGKVKITIHIESNDASVVADKLVVGNQMKGTINSIYNEVITTKDGRPVDLKFSFKSLFARMVLSLRDKLIGNELTDHITKQAINIYRGK